MSWITDSSELVSGGWLTSAYPGHGVTGAEILATTGDGPNKGWLFNDVDSGDAAKEFRAVILTQPSLGTFVPNENGTGTFTANVPDGTYTFTYQLIVDGVNVGSPATGTIVVGAGTTPVQSDLGISYAIAASVQSDLLVSYAMAGAVQSDLPISYSVLNAAQSDLQISYPIAAAVQSDQVLSYAIAGAVVSDLAISYNIENVGTVVSDLAISYGIAAPVQSDLAISYPVAQAVESDLAISYTIQTDSGGVADPAAVWQHVLPNGKTAQQTLMETHEYVLALARIHGLVLGEPLIVDQTSRRAGPIEQEIAEINGITSVSRLQ